MAGLGQDGTERDRDTGGRARNARPRDALGRPMPYGSQGVPTMPDDLSQPPEQAIVQAQDLLDAGRPFHAHEVLEALWKDAVHPADRELWQGLAQLAVGLTHEARGNTVGAGALIRRGRERIAGVGPNRLVDTNGVVAWADAWLAGDRSQPLLLNGPAAPRP